MNRGLNEEEEIWGWIFQPDKEQVQDPVQLQSAVLNTHLCSPGTLKDYLPLICLQTSTPVYHSGKGQPFLHLQSSC